MPELYNRDVQDDVTFLEDVKTEMLFSQSSRLHRGFIEEERRRFVELINQLAARVASQTTGDFPETHPVALTE